MNRDKVKIDFNVSKEALFERLVDLFCVGYDESIYNTLSCPNPYDDEQPIEWVIWQMGHTAGSGVIHERIQHMLDNF